MTERADVAFVLQKAVAGLLIGAMVALDGVTLVPVYDHVPEDKALPYPFVAIGDDQVVAAAAECFEDSVDITSTIHVYSSNVGRLETKSIIGRIKRLMTSEALSLAPDWTLLDVISTGSHVVEDEDGTTTHGIVTFKILADPA